MSAVMLITELVQSSYAFYRITMAAIILRLAARTFAVLVELHSARRERAVFIFFFRLCAGAIVATARKCFLTIKFLHTAHTNT